MKLGDKVKFQNYLSRNAYYKDVNCDETIKFCQKHDIKFWEYKDLYGGYNFRTRLRVLAHKNLREGIVVGKRNVDATGHNEDGGWCFGKFISVYVIATNLSSTYRVPEEYIITE
jgi:hypothetical protein